MSVGRPQGISGNKYGKILQIWTVNVEAGVKANVPKYGNKFQVL
jgi:hypothetical protein